MKLTNKIHVYTTVLFIVLLMLINIAIYFSFRAIMYDSALEQAKRETTQVLEGLSAGTDTFSTQDLLRAYVPPHGMIRIVNNEGQTVSTVTGGDELQLANEMSIFYPGEESRIRSIDETPYAFTVQPVVWTDGEVASLQFTASLAPEEGNLGVLRLVLGVVTGLAVIPLFISARLLSNLITHPIVSLIQTMDRIRRSGKFQRIDVTDQSKDELSQMRSTFNRMMDQLESNHERQEQFISNASHELKTPLTIIESYSSLLKRRGCQDESLFGESVEAIHSEALRMRELTQQLLLLAKQDEHWEVEWQVYSLSDLLSTVAHSFEKAYGREVLLDSEEIDIMTDEQKLKQLLYILMDNARKYSDQSIQLVATQEDGKAVIQVIDQGSGISEENIPKVFDRFYQGSESRTSSEGGFGLGLSLAKELAEVLKAEVTLDSELGKGTTAIIIIDHSQ